MMERPTGASPLLKIAASAGLWLSVTAFAFAIWIVPLELAARYWIGRYGDPLDKASAVLRMDAELGWRQKERLRRDFLGLPLETDELGFRNPARPQAPGRNILVLGPSSTFGWGVREEETYSRRLEGLLRERRGLAVNVVNAGQIGFSTWQGLALHRKHFQGTKPDVLIVAYGVNDVDRYRFFVGDPRPDGQALAPGVSRWTVALQNVAGRLSLLHVARRKSLQFLDRASCSASRGRPAQPVAGLRVSPEEFASNFAGFLDVARREGSKTVFITTAFMLPRRPAADAAARRAGQAALEEGLRAFRGGDCGRAAPAFERALAADPGQLETGYYLSACRRSQGQCTGAKEAFERARGLEPSRIERDVRGYNETVRSLAKREKVPLVDAERILGRLSGSPIESRHPKGLSGPCGPGCSGASAPLEGGKAELFVDPIHPSAEGHRRLAEALYERIVRDRLLEG